MIILGFRLSTFQLNSPYPDIVSGFHILIRISYLYPDFISLSKSHIFIQISYIESIDISRIQFKADKPEYGSGNKKSHPV